MNIVQSLRKNAGLLLSGLATGVVVLVLMRQFEGEPLLQPQSDFGIVIGAALVAAIMIVRDLRESNGKPEL